MSPCAASSCPNGSGWRPPAGGETLTFSPRGLVRDARWVIEGPGGRRLVVEVHGVTGRVAVAAPRP